MRRAPGAVDAASNVTSHRLRDATSIAFSYDALNRLTLKDLPGTEPNVSYTWDNLERLTGASQTGHALSFTWDALGRNLTQVGPQGTVTSQWDVAGRRTRLTYPGSGLYLDYDYLVTGEMAKIRENGATSGIGVLATFSHDDSGRRTDLTRGNGTVSTYGYDAASRLASLAENLAGTTSDQSSTFSYSPASQISSLSKTNDSFAWTGHGSGTTNSVANGLNQLASVGGSATAHDARGNLTSDPTSGKTYGYSSENLLTSASGGVALGYDPLTRLHQLAASVTTRFAYDGLDMIAEYDGSNALQRRLVHGPAVDEPLVKYEGSGTTDRRFLHPDERGSIVAISDASGNMLSINRYDEYGKPQSTNAGRFQYTGQMWLPELGLYHYKARVYAPHLGQFLQTDPIGYDDGPNLYAYVGNDPVNFVDPLGLQGTDTVTACKSGSLNVGTEGFPICVKTDYGSSWGGYWGSVTGYGGDAGDGGEITVIGKRKPKQSSQPQNVQCPAVNPGNMGTTTEMHVAMRRPGWQVINAYLSSRISLAETQANFFRSQLHNGPGDAWRHFRWNFAMARSMGSKPAAAFANAHEVSNRNSAAEHAMDMYNNAMGRAFASNPRYANLPPNEAANLALRSGCLQTSSR